MSSPVATVQSGGWPLPGRARPAKGPVCGQARHTATELPTPVHGLDWGWRTGFASVTITYFYSADRFEWE
ncbi:hypothetical protein F4558_002728 [Micromonospora profundi]|nr:hypothetical protein [Micromonospora profundi]